MILPFLFLSTMDLFSLDKLPTPRSYGCLRTESPISLDGKLDGPQWKNAPWTEDFLDIQGPALPKPRFRTRAKMLWDDMNLYLGAELEEPDVWATLTEHDSVIFRDNDFEVFIDPDDDGQLYSELEMNALNTTWDLLLVHSYRGGGPPLNGWEIKGLKTAVHVDGTLNRPGDRDHGWTVEIAIPWAAMAEIARCPCPPRAGDQWRINFSRVEWHVDAVDGRYRKRPNQPEDNWVWSPMGVIDMHRPERWGIVQFSDQTQGPVAIKPHPGLAEKEVLVSVWEAEQSFRRTHGRWGSPEELPLSLHGATVSLTRDLLQISYGGYNVDQNLRFWRD